MEITATPIKWKKEKVGYVSEVKKKQKMRPMVNQSFFAWFSLVEEKEIFEDFEDEIADSIKEDIWPNPLAYFVSTTVPLSAVNLDGDIVNDKKVTEEREVENEHYVVSFERILKIEGDIQKIKKKAKDHVLEVEQVHNEVCKKFYYKRHEIIKTIPDFWQIAFLSHPVLTTFIREEDEKIFKHLTSLEVEGMIIGDVKFSYMISFNFENTKLSKTCTFVGKESKVNATPVDWKNKEVHNVAYRKLSPGSDVSFFMWFNVLEEGYLREMEIIQDLDDMIAISIKEDLWLNPLSYFSWSMNDADEKADARIEEV